MSATKFTTSAATIIGTTKIPVETAAGVKGYATPLTLSLSEAKGADIASVAGVTDIGAATGGYIHVTGTEAITGLGTCTAGQRRTVKFTGACTLTHNGTSLILPGAANITTAANDTAEFASLGSGNWVCLWYKRQSAMAALAGANTDITSLAGTATNDNAAAGKIGEIISSDIPQGSAVSVSTATTTNITSISLTAGDWDVNGTIAFTNAGGGASTNHIVAIGPTSATLPTPTNGGGYAKLQLATAADAELVMPTGTMRVSLDETTTYYLLGRAAHSGGSMTGWGHIRARRAR